MADKITTDECGYLMLQGSWTDEEVVTYFRETSDKITNLNIAAEGFETYSWLKTLPNFTCLVMKQQKFDVSSLPNGLTTLNAKGNTITSL